MTEVAEIVETVRYVLSNILCLPLKRNTSLIAILVCSLIAEWRKTARTEWRKR
jgi:hypothetical protein